MSWLGVNLNDSLNSLKGQLSNLTKEVLADDADDAINQGQNSDFQDGIEPSLYSRKDLESLVLRYKHKVDELRRHELDLEERLRVSDFENSKKNAILQQELRDAQEQLRILHGRSQEWGWEVTSLDTHKAHPGSHPERSEPQENVWQLQLKQQRENHQAEILALQDTHRLQILEIQRQRHEDNENPSQDAADCKVYGKTEPDPGSTGQERDQTPELRKEISSLKTQLELAESERTSLSRSLEELDSEHRLITEQILAKRNALSQELAEAKSSLNKAQEEIDSYKDAVSAKSRDLDSLRATLEEAQKDNENISIEMTQKLAKLSEENQELSTTSSNHEKAFLSIKEKLEEKEGLLNNLQLSLVQATNQLSEAHQENSKLKSDLDSNRCKDVELQQIISGQQKLTEENASLKHQLAGLSEGMAQKEKLISELNDKLVFKDEEILKHEAIFEEKCSEHSDMYDRMMATRANFETREKEFQEETKTLRTRISLLESKGEGPVAPSSLDAMEVVVSKWMEQSHAQSIEHLPKMWAELESEVASLRCERDKIHESLSSTEQELRGAQDLLEALEMEKNDVERECEDLRDQLEELQCGERQPPEGSLTPRALPTIEEESELTPCTGIEECLSEEEKEAVPTTESNSGNLSVTKQHDQNVLAGQCQESELLGRDLLGAKERDSLAEKDDKISQLDEELAKQKTLLIYKLDQMDQLKVAIDQIKEIFGLKDSDLRQTYISIRQEYTSLLSKLDAKESEIAEFKKTNSDLEIANNLAKFEREGMERSFSMQLAEKNSIIEATKAKMARFQSENVGLNENLTMLLTERSQHADIELRYNKVVSENSQKEEEIKSLIAAKEEMAKKLHALAEDKEEASKKNEEMAQEREDTLKKSNQEHDAAVTELEKQLESSSKELRDKEEQLTTLRTQLETLSANSSSEEKLGSLLETSTKEKASLEASLKDCEEEKRLLQEEVAALSGSLEKREKDFELLQEETKQLSEEHSSTSLELANLQQERHQMIATSTQKHQEAIAYYAEIQRLSRLLEQEKQRWSKEEEELKADLSEAQKNLEKASKSSKDNEDVTKLQVKRLQDELTQEKNSHIQLKEEHTKAGQELSTIQKERDQLWKANSSFNEQYKEARKELVSLQEKEKTVELECSRLRDHLKAIEESTTQEAMQAEQRESTLRQTIAKLHEKMASHSNIYTSANQRNAAQVETLQEELREVTHERDDARHRLSAAEESSLQYQESLTRLQQVLSDFQKSQGREISQATEREKRRLEAELHKNQGLQAEISQLKSHMSEVQSVMASSNSLRAELQSKEDTIVALKSQVYSIQQAAKKTQERVVALQTSSDSKVDKPLLRNLFVGYFATPSDQQKEVLRIIAQVLDFSPEERSRTGLDSQPGSWLTSIANFLAPPPSNIRVTSKVDVLDHSSLSQAFIRFLEEETAPRPQARLPAVEMAEQATTKAEKKLQAAKNIAKNNRLASMGADAKTASALTPVPTSSPLLDAQLALNLPTFHPLPDTPHAVDEGAPSSNASTAASTTPANATGSSNLPPETPLSTPNYLSSLLSYPREADSGSSS